MFANSSPTGSVIMKLFKKRDTYRFFLRSGNYFDVRATNIKIKYAEDTSITSYTIVNNDRWFHCNVTEIAAIVEVK